MRKIGVIGFGVRLNYVLCQVMYNKERNFQVVALCDIDLKKAQEKASKYPNIFSECRYYTNIDTMLEAEDLDGIMIGTRCNFHASYALKVIERQIPLFLEKPVCVTKDEFKLLTKAYHKYHPKVIVSFPLRSSSIVQRVKSFIDMGIIGEVEHVQAFNDVPYGGIYYHGWYRDDQITGGLWLQKATHDFDYLMYILNKHPETICAMTSKEIFKGHYPLGQTCDTCKDKENCPESPINIEKRCDTVQGSACCFAVDTGNMDCGSAIIRYDGGIVSYNQNFFARFRAGRRGARFYGYKGTLDFDFRTNQIKIYHHMENKTEEYPMESNKGSHFGGDEILCDQFWRMVCGDDNVSSTLYEGLLSIAMCFAAKESSESSTFATVQQV